MSYFQVPVSQIVFNSLSYLLMLYLFDLFFFCCSGPGGDEFCWDEDECPSSIYFLSFFFKLKAREVILYLH